MPILSASPPGPLTPPAETGIIVALSALAGNNGILSTMDVRLLEACRAVVDHRSVTQAAAAMGVTQPAVSVQIARLEQELGFPLFERTNGRLKPTGMLFYAEVDKLLAGMDCLSQAARQIRVAQAGRL